MRLEPPESVRTLQRALYRKAKSEPPVRVYLLYDKVHRADVLRHAWALVRANGGAAGIDGVTVTAVEADGVESFRAHLAEELRPHTYRPDPVRRAPRGTRSPSGVAVSGPSASRRSGTGWCELPRSWSWSRSARRTFSRARTAFGRRRTPTRPSRRSASISPGGHAGA